MRRAIINTGIDGNKEPLHWEVLQFRQRRHINRCCAATSKATPQSLRDVLRQSLGRVTLTVLPHYSSRMKTPIWTRSPRRLPRRQAADTTRHKTHDEEAWAYSIGGLVGSLLWLRKHPGKKLSAIRRLSTFRSPRVTNFGIPVEA